MFLRVQPICGTVRTRRNLLYADQSNECDVEISSYLFNYFAMTKYCPLNDSALTEALSVTGDTFIHTLCGQCCVSWRHAGQTRYGGCSWRWMTHKPSEWIGKGSKVSTTLHYYQWWTYITKRSCIQLHFFFLPLVPSQAMLFSLAATAASSSPPPATNQ